MDGNTTYLQEPIDVAKNTDTLEMRDPVEGSSNAFSLVSDERVAKRKLPNDDQDSDRKKIRCSATDQPSKENSHHENDSIKPQDETLAAASHSGESKHSRTPSEEQNVGENMPLATSVPPPQISGSIFNENSGNVAGNEDRQGDSDSSGNRASTSSSSDTKRHRPRAPSPSQVNEGLSSDSDSSSDTFHMGQGMTLLEFDGWFNRTHRLSAEDELRLAEYSASQWLDISPGSSPTDEQMIANRVLGLYAPQVEE